MRITPVHTIFLLFLSLHAFGQNGVTGNPDWIIKPTYNYGFILEHRSTLGHLVKGYPDIFELNIGKPTLGNKLWHIENNKPDIGVSLSVIDFKNQAQLGYAFSLAPYAEIPLNRKERASRLVMRLCWGITYLNKSFDVKTNPKNIAIGSHINSFVQFKWFWHIYLNRNIRFEPGFSFSHCSNARAKVPNLGLNVVTLNAGLNFRIPGKQKTAVDKIDSNTRVRSKNELLVYSAFGYNQREVTGPNYYCGLWSAEYHRNIRNTHKFGVGIDVFADQNYMEDYFHENKQRAEGINTLRVAAKVCYSYNIGRVSFPIDIGYYVFQKVQTDGFLVSRIGVKYYSASGIVASIGLRTHFAVAYDFEYGLGYRFYLGKK